MSKDVPSWSSRSVRSPCAVGLSVQFHQWFRSALDRSAILPTIWHHRWSVVFVGSHAA